MKTHCPLKNKGMILAILTALISGFSIFLNKIAVTEIQSPLVLTTTKNLGVSLLLLLVVFKSGSYKKVKKISKSDKLSLFLIGIIGGAIPFYLFFTGLSMIPAVNAAFIHKTLILWIAILALPLLGEKLNIFQMLAAISLFGSNLFLSGFTGLDFSTGELLILVATILWALENVMSKRILERVDSNIVMFSRMGIGSILLLIISLVIDPKELISLTSLGYKQWFWVGLTSFSLFGYIYTWYNAIKLEKLTTAAVVLTVSPLITNILSALFMGNKVSVLSIIQFGILVLGTVLFLLAEKDNQLNEESLDLLEVT